jgi:hypothetical protein
LRTFEQVSFSKRVKLALWSRLRIP